MFHVGIVAALLADPVLFIRRVDCFHFLSQGGESGLAESVIHGDMLRLVTIRAKMELLWHVSCQMGGKSGKTCNLWLQQVILVA
jgi:hypothetical protein